MSECDCSFRLKILEGLKQTKQKMLSFLDKFAITSNLALHNNTVPQYYKWNNM